ncbi:hypothetical protein U9M48_012198 [Paspalum notatum var. saurae]|uniref:Uncharacterized protein n=1 Tax=Paspalum notatum var. saurae TaxID=547442 RepID=A0AAQ3SYI1_PASNO
MESRYEVVERGSTLVIVFYKVDENDSRNPDHDPRSQGRCSWNCLSLGGADGEKRPARMAMPWGVAAGIVDMVWAVLAAWVSTCLVIANELARGMRSGDIGPFVVG